MFSHDDVTEEMEQANALQASLEQETDPQKRERIQEELRKINARIAQLLPPS